jgi:transposase
MSLKSLKENLSEEEEIVSVTRKELSLPLTSKKIEGIKLVISKSVAAQNFFLKSFSGIQSLLLSRNPRSLRDRYVNEGLPVELAKLGLQDRQWKMSLEKAFETIASSRAITEAAVGESLKRSKLSPKEVHLVRYLLKRPEPLQLILNGKIKSAQALIVVQSEHARFDSSLKEALGTMNVKRVLIWLRRCYRESHARHQKPILHKKRTYHLDPNMYSFIKNKDRTYIAIASLEARKRILIPLTNRDLTAKDFSGNIKVVLRHDGKVEVHRSINTIVKKPQVRPKEFYLEGKHRVTAVDKGFTDLLHSTSGQKYGAGYGVKMSAWSDSIQKRNSGRARLHSLSKELGKRLVKLSNEPTHSREVKRLGQKISRIRKNNLGSMKVASQRETIKKEVQKEIGTAVNSFFRAESFEVLVVERLDFEGSSFYGRRTNRLLKTWHKGLLQDALVKSAKMNSVHLDEINAAYTSQLCRSCDAVDAKNRKGDQFDCIHCGYKGDANYAASLNIRDRFYDSEIGLYTPYMQVKEILMTRHRLGLSQPGLERDKMSVKCELLKNVVK